MLLLYLTKWKAYINLLPLEFSFGVSIVVFVCCKLTLEEPHSFVCNIYVNCSGKVLSRVILILGMHIVYKILNRQLLYIKAFWVAMTCT